MLQHGGVGDARKHEGNGGGEEGFSDLLESVTTTVGTKEHAAPQGEEVVRTAIGDGIEAILEIAHFDTHGAVRAFGLDFGGVDGVVPEALRGAAADDGYAGWR